MSVGHEVTPVVAVPGDADVGEGPVFDPRTGALCWVDITAGTLTQTNLTTGTNTRWTLDTLLGAAAPRRTEPGFAVAVADGFGVVEEGHLTVLDAVLTDPQLRMNDAKCDARGRLWAGSTDLDFATGAGSLHRWDGGQSSRIVRRGFALPNGIGWDAASTTMYVIDSMPGTILSARFDLDRGEVDEFQLLARVDDGLPDGLAVDVDGCIWVAVWGGSAVHRFSDSGKLLETIRLPVTQPSSCAFGPDGILYVTSARSGLDATALRSQPSAGSIFAVRTDTRGVPVASFAG